jgi:hypothetical protein
MNINDSLPEIFKYTPVELPNKDAFGISPSCVSQFFEYPVLWYKEQLAGLERSFNGNTSTVLGTICHYIYKCVTDGKEVNRKIINKQLNKYNIIRQQQEWEELDIDHITNTYPLVSAIVVNEYLITSNNKTNTILTEFPVMAEINNTNIFVRGTLDRFELDTGTIVDFKTVGKLPTISPNQTKLPFNYRIQLLSYAYALRKLGYEVNNIKIVYGVVPTKTISARCIEFNQQVDTEDDKLINDVLNLIAETVIISKNKPELNYIIFKSYDLK